MTCAPASSSMRRIRMRASKSSSTTRTRTPSRLGSGAAGAGAAGGVRDAAPAAAAAPRNVAPVPLAGARHGDRPPCASTRWWTIARPRPRPPWPRWCRRAPGGTARRRAAGSPARCRGRGRDRELEVRLGLRSRTSTRPPSGENFTALSTRFHTTCWKRAGSQQQRLAVALEGDVDGDVAGARRRLDVRERGGDRLGRVEPLPLELQLARRDARHVEQVGDQLRLHARVALDRVDARDHVGVAAARRAA